MKAFRLIGMALVAMCLCMNFASCSNEDVVAPEDPQEEKYVTVGLGCTGEFLEFSESQMGRAATDELYGIQVYALTPIYMHDNPETGEPVYSYQETPYAYGVYTSLDNVKIRLLQEQKYKFEVGVVIDPYKKTSDIYMFFSEDLNNTAEFIYSSNSDVYQYTVDYINEYCYDRYYGELDMYTPEENGVVNINTKRVSYGVNYVTTGLGIGESLTVEVHQMNDSNGYSVELGTEPNEGIYTFKWIEAVWASACRGEVYASDKMLTISWNKADGTVVPMGTYAVTFKRNVMTTIKINAENLNTDNGIKVFKEEASMVPDETIYEINGGKVTEVPVIPGN